MRSVTVSYQLFETGILMDMESFYDKQWTPQYWSTAGFYCSLADVVSGNDICGTNTFMRQIREDEVTITSIYELKIV